MALTCQPGCALPQDVSFWLPEQGFTENNLCEVVRGIAGDMVESVSLIDSFTHPKKQRTSHCYRRALLGFTAGHCLQGSTTSCKLQDSTEAPAVHG